ncbi:MAG: molecular chaperone DnaK, partial [Planctomycetota bacterium]
GGEEKVQFHRVAVGEHLILGGDNFDLALAHYLEQKLAGGAPVRPGSGDSGATDGSDALDEQHAEPRRLDPRQWATLSGRCRQVKEMMLGANAPPTWTIHLPGSGSRLLGGGLQIEITREEVEREVLEGFFPAVALEDRPARRRSGFQEFGLPYAPDAAITRYLAAFLTAHRFAGDLEPHAHDFDPARPDIVLFNGGVFESAAIRARLLGVIGQWFAEDGKPWSPVVLDNDRLDLAVARGAAYYGMVRRGEGVRIAAGLARTYYIGVETEGAKEQPYPAASQPTEAERLSTAAELQRPAERGAAHAVCLVPAGVEPGDDIELPGRRFDLLVSEPVEFPLYVSSTRLTDRPGEILPVDREQMTSLPPIRTVLQTRKRSDGEHIQVALHARLTEIGTLDLWCSEHEGRGSWRLQFDIRSATQTDRVAHDATAEREGFVDEATWQECARHIEATFGESASERPEDLVKRLSAATGMSRNAWPTSLCRRIWEALMEVEAGRRKSAVHEARWLNLLGFALRPGYGLAVDDWRVAETWRTLQGKFAHATSTVRGEGWILWRRIAGGLQAGQHLAIAEPLLSPTRSLHRQLTTGKGRGGDVSFTPQETAEVWRLLGSLELLPVERKIELGDMLLDMLPKRRMEPVRPAMTWAIGRLGARVPLYGPLNSVVPVEAADRWLMRLLDTASGDGAAYLALMQIARRTDDRYRDISQRRRENVLAWLSRESAPGHYATLVERGGSLDTEEQGLVFGESLPKGLRIA